MLAVVAPGQGAQAPGMLEPWLEEDGVRERITAYGEAAGLDLLEYGTTADAATITDTKIAQPLIVATGLAALPLAVADRAAVGVFTGHSVGEITATAAAGILSETDAMRLVAERGRAMADAAARTPTGMTAILGGDRDTVLATLERHGVTPANDNGAGQIVAAGTLEQLAELAADPPPGARLRPLQVAGAFHTVHMAPAVDALERTAADLRPADPAVPVLSNADGAAVASGADALHRLVRQVSSPVRWDLVMAAFAAMGVTAVLELPPAGTLVGLVKRGVPGIATLALKTPADLPAARELVAEHGGRG